MEQRQFFRFFIVSMGIWLLWFHFVVPRLFPNLNPQNKPAAKFEKSLRDDSLDADSPADALLAENVEHPQGEAAPKANLPQIPNHAFLRLMLGPADGEVKEAIQSPSDEFLLAASLNSAGAAVEFAELTDKKQYPAFGNRGHRAHVLGASRSLFKTFAMNVPEIDEQLGNLSLDQIAWEIVPEPTREAEQKAATFRIVSPDGRWELTKHFELTKLTADQLKQPNYKNNLVDGYELKLTIKIRNLSNQPQQISYQLQGPVGVPLEDPENSYKYRDIRMGFLRDDGTLDEGKLSASETVKKEKNKKTEIWKRKIKYIGVDVLYFAALIMPGKDQLDSAKAVVAAENLKKSELSDVSVELQSVVLTVPGQDSVEHEYTLFAGPKRKELMGHLSAVAVMDFGWFDSICRGMIWLLNLFHHLGFSYGVAIICLTALVRTLLMPISKHQAANAEKMKELQPKITEKLKELEAKYGKNTEEYMKAAQEVQKENLGLMMSGCLPAFLQLPIFIALYRAIGSSIELRMEPFLWFENLASPDALFKLPFVVPWFGWTHFNLLPCISTGLMFVHQKLTMPPPTNEEQAQQQKMMSIMMVVMAATFYRVPSGLCLYFIATNVWSMTERWVFQHFKKKRSLTTDSNVPVTAPALPVVIAPKAPPEKPSALGEMWNRLQQAADNQVTSTRQLDNSNSNRGDKKKKKR